MGSRERRSFSDHVAMPVVNIGSVPWNSILSGICLRVPLMRGLKQKLNTVIYFDLGRFVLSFSLLLTACALLLEEIAFNTTAIHVRGRTLTTTRIYH